MPINSCYDKILGKDVLPNGAIENFSNHNNQLARDIMIIALKNYNKFKVWYKSNYNQNLPVIRIFNYSLIKLFFENNYENIIELEGKDISKYIIESDEITKYIDNLKLELIASNSSTDFATSSIIKIINILQK